ncbi:TRAP transporter small permease [Ammoniphilus resinae]|uniref:TRAP-type C4-dicarboxylate transport system permease small subunit n=1 Tax=Ammoniphilus resinae TaxID=861532 RepID=A0ABS4GVF5_9BACL|nr:TRAP transporter small permease [Ammoniphilus resinae]MBP1933865.1 TRAP-type C4-dicarboxylate transport system permease small subunit [Ammoniphilus resinae]
MESLVQGILKCVKAIIVVLMFGMIITVSYGVFTRYVLHDAAVWTGEISGYILVWITFLGSAWAVFEKSHISFDALLEKMPRTINIIIQLVFNLSMITFVAILTYYGFIVTGNALHDEMLTLPFTKALVYGIVPVSGILMILAFLIQIAQLFSVKADESATKSTTEFKIDTLQ